MNDFSSSSKSKFFLTLTAITIVAVFLSALLTKVSLPIAAVAFLGIAICLLTFLKPEVSIYVLAFSMLLSPEFGQRTTQGSGVTLRADDFLLVLIGLSWFTRSALYKDVGLFRKTKLNIPIFIYMAVCVVSTAFGMMLGNVPVKSGFFFVLKYFEYYVVFFMVVNHIRTRNQIKYLIISVLATCVIVDIVALIHAPSAHRLSAPFEGGAGEPNTFGGYLLLMLMLAVSLFDQLDSRKAKAFLFMTICLSIVPFLLTLSRGSYLAIIPAYFTLIILARKKRLLIAAFLMACSAAPFFMPDKVVDRIMYTFNQRAHHGQEKIGGTTLDTSTSARIRSWESGFDAAIKRPVLGYGVTGWHFIDNQFTKVLVETGFLGLAAFLFLLFSIFKEGYHVYKNSDDKLAKGLSAGLIAGLVGLIVHSLGANTFIIVRVMEPFWLIAGLVVAVSQVSDTGTSGQCQSLEYGESVNLPKQWAEV